MVGKVNLVGAGPGDPDLLTVKARRLIDTCDVILYDRLIDQRLVDTFPGNGTHRNVGKRAGAEGRITQEEINRRMVRHARAGATVVRLKCGDPTVFGRGGEEAEYLAAADIPFEIVPGVSSVVAAPGVVGIPLTHREHASSVTIVTGHEAADKDTSSIDWSALVDIVTAGGTLLILMGVRRLPENCRNLRDAGLSPSTPVAMIERATWEDENTVTGTLDTIVERASTADIAPPAMTVVGDVVSVRERVLDSLDRAGSPADVLSAQTHDALLTVSEHS